MVSDKARSILLAGAAVLVFAPGLIAQDVELLGRIHGTRPPQAYYDLIRRDPGAFQYRRALMRRGLNLDDLPDVRPQGQAMAPGVYRSQLATLSMGQRVEAVEGTFNFPLILGLFSDSPDPLAPYSQTNVQREFFDGPNSRYKTIPEFYAEISGNRVSLTGVTFDWVRGTLTRSAVTAGVSGLGTSARTGQWIVQTISILDDGTLDWGQFDNDGPDGVPNSGDDDGYVDVLAVMHPTPGGECSSSERPNRIWSHRWNLYASAFYEGGAWAQPILDNEGYVTETPSAGGGFIKILDYTIQPVTNCAASAINTIGVFAHELGHGFGLPDLYGVGSSQNGIGNWGLMGTGSWGCNGSSSERPCHMSAWSKAVLGWADSQTLSPGTDLGTVSLDPVESSGTVYRLDSGDGSGEYLLLENRQRIGFDENLYEPGLLVWHIDPVTITANWPSNTINSDGDRLGVWLRGADGRNDLARGDGGRGDAGDPFPGQLGITELHAGTRPGSWTHGGRTMGLTLLDIQGTGQTMSFRALTRYQALTLETRTVQGEDGLITVDGVSDPGLMWTWPSAPFETHTVEAAPGEPISEGYRYGFKGWTDGAPRVREFTTQLEDATLTAEYEGRQVHLDVELVSPVPGITPGAVEFTPGDASGWTNEGETVVIRALPQTGFAFDEWAGALAGQPNPTTVEATAPLEAEARFDLTFSTASNPAVLEVEASKVYNLSLVVENANPPVTWSILAGELPEGMSLDQIGKIRGVAMEKGSYPLSLSVRDGIGLSGTLTVEVKVVDPVIPLEILTSPFLLTGLELELNQRIYLDRNGNRNGSYDLGDLRAFVLANPDLPISAAMVPVLEKLIPMGDMRALSVGGKRGGRGEEIR